MNDFVDWPPGYEALEISEVSHVSLHPGEGKAIILFTSIHGQKIALVARMDDLIQVMAHLATLTPRKPDGVALN